jgi:hypothetical protein
VAAGGSGGGRRGRGIRERSVIEVVSLRTVHCEVLGRLLIDLRLLRVYDVLIWMVWMLRKVLVLVLGVVVKGRRLERPDSCGIDVHVGCSEESGQMIPD